MFGIKSNRFGLEIDTFLPKWPHYLGFMVKRSNEPDIITLSGDPIERAQQVLDVARHQVRLAQNGSETYQVEDALNEAEEAVDTARAHVADAVEANLEAEQEAGKAAQGRRASLPTHRSE